MATEDPSRAPCFSYRLCELCPEYHLDHMLYDPSHVSDPHRLSNVLFVTSNYQSTKLPGTLGCDIED